MTRFTLTIVVSCLLISCDFRECDLTIINHTNEDLYFYTHPLHQEKKFSYNFALRENYLKDSTLEKYYYKFEPNNFSVPMNDTVKDCIINRSFKQFAKEYEGLTIVTYLKDVIEEKPKSYNYMLQEKDIFKKIDLTFSELEESGFTVIIK